MNAASPSWNLSLYVRSTIVCRNQPVNASTVTDEVISEVAGNMTGNGHDEIAGYDAATVRAILLDSSVKPSLEAPAAYAGK